MEQEFGARKGFLGGVAKVLNVSGSAMVIAYDSTMGAMAKSYTVVKKAVPAIPSKTASMFSGSFKLPAVKIPAFRLPQFKMPNIKVKTGEIKDIEAKIGEYEEKIKASYYEIGKEGTSSEQLESDKVRKLISDAKEYEREIERLKSRISEIDEQLNEERSSKEALRKEKKKKETPIKKLLKVSEKSVPDLLRGAIEKAVKHGAFETDSDKAIFDKIANDLLDNEMEVKILAATELGKIANPAAVPILFEAVKYGNSYLTTEIINALINMDDQKAVSLFKDTITDANHKVRISSLRGLYKLGSDDEILPVFLECLKDDHAEVRRTAITYIGWKDYVDSVPGLVQTLLDKEEKVRKAAVSALANIKDKTAVLPLMRVLSDSSVEIREKALDTIKAITGQDVTFDLNLTDKELTDSINDLKEWWQSERLSNIDLSVTESMSVDDLQMDNSTAVEDKASESAFKSSYDDKAEDEVSESAFKSSDDDVAGDDLSMDSEESEEVVDEPAPQEEASFDTDDSVEELPQAAEEESGTEEEEISSDAEGRHEYSESQLRRMTKDELISIAGERGIDCDVTFTKAEIIKQIIG